MIDLNIVPLPGKLNTAADALSRRSDYVNQVWRIYNKSDVYHCHVIATPELSSRINETSIMNDNVEALTSQLNVLSILTVESSTSERQLLNNAVTKACKSDPFVRELISQKEKVKHTAHGKYVLLNDVIYYVNMDEKYLLYVHTS